MKKLIVLLAALFIFAVPLVYAQASVTYPVTELGNCGSQKECEAYCDNSENMIACLDYAEQNNLMTPEEIAEARKIAPLIVNGETPGKCKSEQECDDYCNKDENLQECVNFAVKIGKVSAEEAETIRKTGGKGPGGCRGKEVCEEYCKQDANKEECINFAVEHGLMTQEEAVLVRKGGFGPGPGGCKGKQECDDYCNMKENQIECLKFGKEHGFIDAEEADMAIEAGGTDRETVDAFCNKNAQNWERCTALWVKKGDMTQEERDKSVVYRTTRLGNCEIGDKECMSEYCNDNNHIEECWKFELAVGMITQEQYDTLMKERQERAALEAAGREEAERQTAEAQAAEAAKQAENAKQLEALAEAERQQALKDAEAQNNQNTGASEGTGNPPQDTGVGS